MDNDFEFCIEALRGAMMLTKQAIQVEIAVCFSVFYQHGGDTGIHVLKELRAIYASAGRVDCLTPNSGQYKTVNRRMGRCADFYTMVGHRRMKKVIGDAKGKAMIEAIKKYIEPYEIECMDDVAAHAGRPRQAPEPKDPPRDRRATDAPGTIHVKTRHVDIPIPPDCPKSELLALAKKLTALAEKMG